jgi:predicted ATPase
MDVAEWLRGLGLEQYAPAFRANDIDGEVLRRLTARLWGEQGRRAEALELLAPAYGWFTEGFDTADLTEARGCCCRS